MVRGKCMKSFYIYYKCKNFEKTILRTAKPSKPSKSSKPSYSISNVSPEPFTDFPHWSAA